MNVEFIINLLGIIAGSSVVSAIIVAFSERGKKRAEAADIITGAAREILDEQRTLIENLRKQLEATERALETEKKRSDALEILIRELQIQLQDLSEEKKFRTIFQLITEPILIVDIEQNCFTDANDAAVLEYGYGREELKTMGYEAICVLDPQSTRPRTAPFTGCLSHKRKNGTTFECMINVAYYTEKMHRFAALIVKAS